MNYYDGNDPHELETNTNKGRPTLSAVERERRKEQFQAFLTRQHAAQERKKIQVQEVSDFNLLYMIIYYIFLS